MRFKKGVWIVIFVLFVSVFQNAYAQNATDSVEDKKAPVPEVVDKSGQGLMWLIGIPMYVASIPAWIFGQAGNTLDNFSADTAYKTPPAPRGVGNAPQEATKIPDDKPYQGA